MEENKYYTPSIEEFHIGFEYEHLERGIWNKYVLEPIDTTCDSDGVHENYNPFSYYRAYWNLEEFRVKYLSKEDIEAEGFTISKPQFQYIDNVKEFWQQDTQNDSIHIFKANSIGENKYIIGYGNNYKHIPLFQGTIKNKSELRKIFKMIGV